MEQAHLEMLEHLRNGEPVPYADREPVPRVIAVAGRRSGAPRPFPVNVTEVDGRLYACSATRDRDWVRNLLAAGRCHIERDGPHGTDTARRPVLVDGDEAATVLRAYLPRAGFTDSRLPFAPDAPHAELARLAHRTAVVRLDPA